MPKHQKINDKHVNQLVKYANTKLGLTMGETFELMTTASLILMGYYMHRNEDNSASYQVSIGSKIGGEDVDLHLYISPETLISEKDMLISMPAGRHVN